jgi:iron uptake system component EfeO
MPRHALPLAALLVSAPLFLVGCRASDEVTSAASTAPSTTSRVVDVSRSDCGSSWHPSTAGEQVLRLHNTDSSPGEVQVVGLGAHQGLVYADVEPFGAGTRFDMHLPLAAGRYALACLIEDSAPVVGPARTITGAAVGTPGVRILAQSELVPATQRYERWVRRQLRPLQRDTHRLHVLVQRGDQKTARSAWLTAHLAYQRLGATYDGFGDLGDAIDGLPSGLPEGTSDPAWSGFHRVERDLWGGARGDRLRADAATLDRAVQQLPALVRNTHLDPLTLTLRAHEITENALQVQLTGKDDFGSHTDLDSVRAELVGTRAVLSALAGPLDSRVHDAATIRSTLRSTLAAFAQVTRSRRHVSVARLQQDERERLDATLGVLAQQLAAVPASLEPRLTVASGSITGGGGS